MFTEKFLEVLSNEGVVSIVTCANNEAHVSNTWNSYIVIVEENKILIPAAAMIKTENNININPNVKFLNSIGLVTCRVGDRRCLLDKRQYHPNLHYQHTTYHF